MSLEQIRDIVIIVYGVMGILLMLAMAIAAFWSSGVVPCTKSRASRSPSRCLTPSEPASQPAPSSRRAASSGSYPRSSTAGS
jgi:hypothetical protein